MINKNDASNNSEKNTDIESKALNHREVKVKNNLRFASP
jgi:hypothetical protein